MDNANPRIRSKAGTRIVTIDDTNDAIREDIDSREVFGKDDNYLLTWEFFKYKLIPL